MSIVLNLNDALELALHRALRGEVPPCVHAVTVDLSARPLQLHVYGHGSDCNEQLSEEVIESELEQCLPDGVDKSLAQIACWFHDATEFDISSGLCLLYLNHHATTD
jgi:hypothetical protein